MDKSFPLSELMEEIEFAIGLRANGKESQSRVIARKAAGKAIRFWLIQKNIIAINGVSPFMALEISLKKIKFPDSIHLSLLNLTQRVKNDYSLPENIDLISDARNIIEFITKKVSNGRF